MTAATSPRARVGTPPMLTRVLTRVAKTGIYLVRGVPPEVQSAARARAVGEGTSLSVVLVHALREYAAGTWTPRRGTSSMPGATATR